MEEDAAKLVHAGGDTGRIAGSDYSMVDFNRGGTPLIEIVTEPDIPSPEAAREFLQQLRNLVVELGVSECNMEEGQVRWDANVSVRPAGSDELGTRTELKNMNSFRFLQQALEAEIPRQIEILEAGGSIDQETLHFDPDTGTTTPLRSKEEAHDYRYFPEPDLVPLEIDPAWVDELRATLPELPAARVERFIERLRPLARRRAGAGQLRAPWRRSTRTWSPGGRRQAGGQLDDGRVPRASQRDGPRARPRPRHRAALAELVKLVDGRHRLDERRQACLRPMVEERGEPEDVVEKHGLARSPTRRSSRTQSPGWSPTTPPRSSSTMPASSRCSGFFVGQVMKATGGRANPKLVNELLRRASTAELRRLARRRVARSPGPVGQWRATRSRGLLRSRVASPGPATPRPHHAGDATPGQVRGRRGADR